jgi:hypothetical protein
VDRRLPDGPREGPLRPEERSRSARKRQARRRTPGVPRTVSPDGRTTS